MKLKNVLFYLFVILSLTIALFAQDTNPVVSNVAFSIKDTTVTVTYDVTDAEQSTVTISMYVSSDGGNTWDYNYYINGMPTGDIGPNIPIGTGKTITWTYKGGNSNDFKIEIIANDETVDGSPCPGTPTVTYGGQVYHTIQIGDQCWLKENLNIGTMISAFNGGSNKDGAQTNNNIIEKYCYSNDVTNCNTYGGLYQWGEAIQYKNGASNTTSADPALSGNVQGICPDGWHIPSYSEWQTLERTVNNSGNSLKATNQGTGDGVGTNTSGFSSLLAGTSTNNDNFWSMNTETDYWSFTENNIYYAYALGLDYSYDDISTSFDFDKTEGLSVRCIKDN